LLFDAELHTHTHTHTHTRLDHMHCNSVKEVAAAHRGFE